GSNPVTFGAMVCRRSARIGALRAASWTLKVRRGGDLNSISSPYPYWHQLMGQQCVYGLIMVAGTSPTTALFFEMRIINTLASTNALMSCIVISCQQSLDILFDFFLFLRHRPDVAAIDLAVFTDDDGRREHLNTTEGHELIIAYENRILDAQLANL